MPTTTNYGGAKLGGGPYNGYMPQQTITNYKDSTDTATRRILRKAWNTSYATGSYNNQTRITTPFRAVNNSGDFLARFNYICGGSNQNPPANCARAGSHSSFGAILSRCDNSGVPSSSCNVRYVPDSSDYTTYRRQQAFNRNYNDSSNGGDQSNASYSFRIGAARGFS